MTIFLTPNQLIKIKIPYNSQVEYPFKITISIEMKDVDLSGPYDFSALDLGSSSGECSFPPSVKQGFCEK